MRSPEQRACSYLGPLSRVCCSKCLSHQSTSARGKPRLPARYFTCSRHAEACTSKPARVHASKETHRDLPSAFERGLLQLPALPAAQVLRAQPRTLLLAWVRHGRLHTAG